MIKYVIDNISVMSILDRRRAYANGEFPVRITVHYNKKTRYYSTGKSCSETTWEKLSNPKSKELSELRRDIQNSFAIIKKHVIDLHAKDDFTIENLDKSLQRISGETLNGMLERKIAVLTKNGQIGTRDTYSSTLAAVTKFSGENIPIESITVKWLEKFEEGFIKNHSVATMGIYMRNIRHMMNLARTDKLIREEQYPFGAKKYEIKMAEGKKKALSFQNLKKIMTIQLGDVELAKIKDLWLFLYYANGMNIADFINLKFKDIDDGEISFIREKTKRTAKKRILIRVPVSKEMQAIIDRWGNEPLPENYIFDTIEHTNDPELHHSRKNSFTKYFNGRMKIIGAAVGIFDVKSYTARHTFATVLKRKGVPTSYIQDCLGHTSAATTEFYLDSFEKGEREKYSTYLVNI